MKKNFLYLWTFFIVTILVMVGFNFFREAPKRETILDKVISIPEKLVANVPYLPPFCEEIPSNFKKGFVEIEDGELYYEEEGQGIPVVLINGGPGNTHHIFHPHFSRINDMARVIYYDQRGTGKSSSDETEKTYTVKQAVDDLESLRKALKIDKWTVLGFSYGGFLAQFYALNYPNNCSGLILVSSGIKWPSTEKNPCAYDPRLLKFVSQKEFDAINDISRRADEGLLSASQRIYNNNLSGYWKSERYYKPTPKEFIRRALYEWSPAPNFRETMLKEIYKISFEGKFNKFKIPTLIARGKWDFLWFNSTFESSKKNYPNARVKFFEKSGHLLFADEPEKFFKILKKFLKEEIE